MKCPCCVWAPSNIPVWNVRGPRVSHARMEPCGTIFTGHIYENFLYSLHSAV